MPIFEASANDPFGLWESAPQTVSFGIGDAELDSPPPAGTVYRLNLPADFEASSAAFRSSEAAIETANAALQSVPSRLDDLTVRTQESRQKQASGVSFDVASLSPEPGPEGDLLASLADIDRGAAGESVSFGLTEDLSGAWRAAESQFEALIAQIDRDVLHFAWVETNISNQLIARTTVDWSGDAQTVWTESVNDQQIALHQRALYIATQTRNLRLRLFVTVTSGAAKMAVLMATPGGAVLALPAMYQYVIKILKQTKELQSMPGPC